MNVRYLRNEEIDRKKWDHCIQSAPNGLVYAYSYYLDQMATHWDAIILDDYSSVMPLPWRKKGGLRYIYQPFLCAQLGLFGSELSAPLLLDFFRAIPGDFRLWEFPLNQGNLFEVPGYGVYRRLNHVLDLNENYERLYENYRENIRRNVKKAAQYGLRLSTTVTLPEILELVQLQSPDTAEEDLRHFEKLHDILQEKGMVKHYGMLSNEGLLLASAIFLFSHGRAYYLLVGNHPNGRTLGASHALIDGFIRDHAGQPLLLDFEGSDIRNLAFFYNSFGSKEEYYTAVRLNRLPWWIRWVKRG